MRSYCLQWHFVLRCHNTGCFIFSPRISQCCMNSKYQGMLQDFCREQSYVQSPRQALLKLVTHKTPSLSGRNLSKVSDDNWSPVGSCSFPPKNEHQDLECAGKCLDSMFLDSCWTEMNSSDPFKTPPRYQLPQECREKEHTCWRNRTTTDLEPMMPKRLLFPRERRVYSSLAHTSHILSQLWERDVRKWEKFWFNTENLSYGSLVTIPPC